MNILIVKTSAIGDVIHTLPALNCLRLHYPEARIDWLVEEAASEAVLGSCALTRVLISPRKKWLKLLRSGRLVAAWLGFREFIRELRSTEYDLLIDFQGLLKSGIFVSLARAKRKVGFGKGMEHAEGSWFFLNEPIPPVDMNQHALKRELLLLEGIGLQCKDIVFHFPVGDEHRHQLEVLLKENSVDVAQPLVIINPMTTWPTKHWYSDRFAQVSDYLQTLGVTVVFTGGPDDVFGISEIMKSMHSQGINLAGKTSLKTLAALYERAALLITTDTGPMHIAAAVGLPVVALFGPTAPWRTGPWGDDHHVLRVELGCSPCLKKKCSYNHECMDKLGVDQVLAAVRTVLGAGH
ncbi:MAG: glycosyltransferase family 9 protein [Desulfobulbaceae bacterium]|nr:glycosyltransferase family 9 protein [Desulfobulbaceae bacterium]MDP2105577.1 glycosyltransferase family 9 protein [Desulfobulbaceae bacterium]